MIDMEKFESGKPISTREKHVEDLVNFLIDETRKYCDRYFSDRDNEMYALLMGAWTSYSANIIDSVASSLEGTKDDVKLFFKDIRDMFGAILNDVESNVLNGKNN